MRFLSTLGVFLFMCSWASGVIAACSGSACVNVFVNRLYLQDQDFLYVGTSGDETGLNCTPVSDIYLTLPDSHMKSREIYATLLAAAATDQTVRIRIVDGSVDCEIRYIVFEGASR